jgi:hypothetical protein
MDKVLGFLIFIVILYGVYNAKIRDKQRVVSSTESCRLCEKETQTLQFLQKELSMIENPQYIKSYIIDVIDHGSDTLGFRGGVMEGGFASHEDAEKIACYVLSLSGLACKNSYPKDAPMFYTSICGGCHGEDGKGLAGGNYPDLTRKKLLGLKQREETLHSKIQKLQKQYNSHKK